MARRFFGWNYEPIANSCLESLNTNGDLVHTHRELGTNYFFGFATGTEEITVSSTGGCPPGTISNPPVPEGEPVPLEFGIQELLKLTR